MPWERAHSAGKGSLCGPCEVVPERKKTGLHCVFLLVTTARLLKISGVVSALLCWQNGGDRGSLKKKEDQVPRKRMAWHV